MQKVFISFPVFFIKVNSGIVAKSHENIRVGVNKYVSIFRGEWEVVTEMRCQLLGIMIISGCLVEKLVRHENMYYYVSINTISTKFFYSCNQG